MASSAAKNKRGPTVLVTDARERPIVRESQWGPPQRPAGPQRMPTQLISVDNVLQYASEIPSGQRRDLGRDSDRERRHLRTPSGRHPLEPKLAGRSIPQHMPTRSSKVSEKLVLLPDTLDEPFSPPEFMSDDESAPPSDDELQRRRIPRIGDKSYAERLPKARRTEQFMRVTAYCTAQGYKMRATADFLRSHHGARTKLYDDCLYTVYHLPLLPGNDGYRIRSSPVLKSPGGKSVLDEQIERNENREYYEGYFGNTDQYGIRGPEEMDLLSRSPTTSIQNGAQVVRTIRRHSADDVPPRDVDELPTPFPPRIPTNAFQFAEMFVFSYGVVVFWNFTERQEKDILADLTFSQSETGIALATRPQKEEEFETEEFHFEYNPDIPRPRVFNDMITLRSGDHMVKVSMSHAIAQSTKLSFFEERMARTMLEAQYVPRRLALTGKLGMKREDVVKILGKLFTSRVDVNLSSNMLDIPNFFWDSEPTLHPLYIAVREYLEIKPRIQVLNERCRVFLDLAEILSDAIADKKMTRITWIIIILIVLSIFVTCSEVFLRFAMLHRGNNGQGAANSTRLLTIASPHEL